MDLLSTLTAFDYFQAHHERACAVELVDVDVEREPTAKTTHIVVTCPQCRETVSGSIHDAEMLESLLQTVRTATGDIAVEAVVDPEALTPTEQDRLMALQRQAGRRTHAQDVVFLNLRRLLRIDTVVPVAQCCLSGLVDVTDRVLLETRRVQLEPVYADRRLAFHLRATEEGIDDEKVDVEFTDLALQVFRGHATALALEELAQLRDRLRAHNRRLDAARGAPVPTEPTAPSVDPLLTKEGRRDAVTEKLAAVSRALDLYPPLRHDTDFWHTTDYRDRSTFENWLKEGAAASKDADAAFRDSLKLDPVSFKTRRDGWPQRRMAVQARKKERPR